MPPTPQESPLTTSQLAAGIIIPVLWISWLVYWIVSARGVKKTSWREPYAVQMRHRGFIIVAALLLAGPKLLPHVLRERFIPVNTVLIWVGTAVVAAGLGLAVWARRHLGQNWSSNVVVKQDHALVRTGPYRWVRHPIYAGIILAFVGAALYIGEWRGLIATVCVFLSFLVKSRAEEAQMEKLFPEYQQYRQKSAALIPLIY
jgi:protein-S-isoprenylcysteine O-methyltransferase Ste14